MVRRGSRFEFFQLSVSSLSATISFVLASSPRSRVPRRSDLRKADLGCCSPEKCAYKYSPWRPSETESRWLLGASVNIGSSLTFFQGSFLHSSLIASWKRLSSSADHLLWYQPSFAFQEGSRREETRELIWI